MKARIITSRKDSPRLWKDVRVSFTGVPNGYHLVEDRSGNFLEGDYFKMSLNDGSYSRAIGLVNCPLAHWSVAVLIRPNKS